MPAVSWPWAPAWGSLEPPRRDGENAQKTRKNGGEMAEIRSKRVNKERKGGISCRADYPPARPPAPVRNRRLIIAGIFGKRRSQEIPACLVHRRADALEGEAPGVVAVENTAEVARVHSLLPHPLHRVLAVHSRQPDVDLRPGDGSARHAVEDTASDESRGGVAAGLVGAVEADVGAVRAVLVDAVEGALHRPLRRPRVPAHAAGSGCARGAGEGPGSADRAWERAARRARTTCGG